MAARADDLERRASGWIIAALVGALGFALSPLINDLLSPDRLREEGETRAALASIQMNIAGVQQDVKDLDHRMTILETREGLKHGKPRH